MNNFLLWICGLVTVCLGLLFAGPHFVDWNGYRGIIEEEASRYFGRRVRVGGEVNLRILPVPYFSFDKLSMADPETSTGTPIIRAENFKMWLNVPPLLQGILEAHHVELRRPVLELVMDNQGGGNWQSLRVGKKALSYMPGGLTIEALDIHDGQILLRNASGAELTRVEDIHGTLSAQAIEGPYKFNGGFEWRQQKRDLRLATARPTASGDVRIKASISPPGQTRRRHGILVDGVASSADGKIDFSGTMSAKVAGLTGAATPPSDQPASAARRADRALFDFKSKLKVDTTQLRLTDINLALETDGPPQLMTGNADLVWKDNVALNVDLGSRWIDFDRFTVSADTAAPLDNARQLLVALGRALPQKANTNVRVSFDQATLGGQALGAIQLEAVRASGPLTLKEFEASVPGGGKLAISGALSVSQNTPGFDGHLSADGQSLLKFLRWGLGDDTLATGLADGPFYVDGKLRLMEDSFAIEDAVADLGNTPLKGDLSMQLGAKRAVRLNLEGHTLDWNRLSPQPFGAGIARTLLAETEAGADEANTGESKTGQPTGDGVPTFAGLGSRSDLHVSLKAANLLDGENAYRDFEGTLIVKAGKLSVPVLRFARDSGLKVDVGGDAGATRKQGTDPARGTVKGIVSAKSHVAILDLLEFLEASDLDPILRKRLTALAPVRVASTIRLGNKSNPDMAMQFDGLSRGGRLVAELHFENGLPSWRTSPAQFTATIANQSADRLFSLVSDSRTFVRPAIGQERPGRLYIKAAGVPAKGLLTRAAIESDDLNLTYYGDVVLEEGQPFAFDGAIEMDAVSTRDTMALVGVELGDGVRGLPIKGRFKVTRKDATLRLSADNVAIDGSQMRGVISLTEQTNAPSKLVADLDVDRATLPGIMRAVLAPKKIKATHDLTPAPNTQSATLVQKAAVTGAPVPVPLAPPESIWPEQHFDLSPLTNVEGFVTVDFNTFSFASDRGLTLNDARLEASLAPGQFSVTQLKGSALGGTTTVAFDINKAAAGADVTGTLNMKVGKTTVSKGSDNADGPDGAPQSGDDAVKYAALFDLNFKGRAFAPSGLAADLDGSGKLVVEDASLTGLTAKEVRNAVAETMKAEGPVNSEAFVATLKDRLKTGQINLGSLNIPVALRDGAVSIAPIEVEGPDGRTTFAASLEVATMKFDSEWKIAAIDPNVKDKAASDGARLPAVTATYVGKLSDVATVDPRLSTGALEREIAVRKMERDVAELERLRKLDEARAKEEQERRRALEARLAEQRRLQAERERQLLLEQQGQQGDVLGVDDLDPIGPDNVPTAEPGLDDPNAAPVVEAPPKPRRRVRKRPPKKDVWNPFQITPY